MVTKIESFQKFFLTYSETEEDNSKEKTKRNQELHSRGEKNYSRSRKISRTALDQELKKRKLVSQGSRKIVSNAEQSIIKTFQ